LPSQLSTPISILSQLSQAAGHAYHHPFWTISFKLLIIHIILHLPRIGRQINVATKMTPFCMVQICWFLSP
jgi:pterin-4a-carbinolamine dehydratase